MDKEQLQKFKEWEFEQEFLRRTKPQYEFTDKEKKKLRKQLKLEFTEKQI